MEAKTITQKWRLLYLLGELGGGDRVCECREQTYKMVQNARLQ